MNLRRYSGNIDSTTSYTMLDKNSVTLPDGGYDIFKESFYICISNDQNGTLPNNELSRVYICMCNDKKQGFEFRSMLDYRIGMVGQYDTLKELLDCIAVTIDRPWYLFKCETNQHVIDLLTDVERGLYDQSATE